METSRKTLSAIRLVITVYIRRTGLKVNICSMLRSFSATLLVLALLAPLAAQSHTDADINARIRQEENSHSQIMKTLHMLADVYGPRVTGSPSLKAMPGMPSIPRCIFVRPSAFARVARRGTPS